MALASNATYESAGTHHVAMVVSDEGTPTFYVDGNVVPGSVAVFDRQLDAVDVLRHYEAFRDRA